MKTTHCLSPEEIESRLLAAGVQPTAQRLAICRFVLCEAEHPTAENVKAWADQNFPKLSLATVYNTLKILSDVGLIKELRLPHSEKVIYDNNVTDHYHFLDEETGELFDVDPKDVELTFKKPFNVSSVEILLRGKRK